MKPIKFLFALFAMLSMLVCSLSAQRENVSKPVKVVGVELRTCTSDAFTYVAIISFDNFQEVSTVQTFKTENDVIYSATQTRPEQIDWGNCQQVDSYYVTTQRLRTNFLPTLYGKNYKGTSCGGIGHLCS